MSTRIFYPSAFIVLTSILFASCSGPEETEMEASPKESCFYAYNEGATTLTWTAFKTNDKVGVPGSFNRITVNSESGEDPKDVLESIEFTIETASVETNDQDRNAKVAEHFFGTINTPEITGRIVALKDNGKALVAISMNGIEVDVEGDYTLEGKVFNYKTSIDLSKWKALEGINKLNSICKDLHTGADGVSKLWSEVTLSLSTTLSSDCD